MPLIEDDAEINPTIPPSQLHYIRRLTDTHKHYTRFFDALLVPRPSHAAFFRDLKGFRSLPTTIQALSLCDPEDVSVSKEQRQQNYKDVTKKFLGSRFAHPWCRKAMAGVGNTKHGGWWGAEWTATGRKMTKENQEQEDKLHKLLIPLWVCFRSRMFPGEPVIQEWLDRHQVDILKNGSSDLAENGDEAPAPAVELRMAKSCSNLKDSVHVSEHDDDDYETTQQAGAAATSLFRLAAAGIIINSMPKMQQWKLKKELKKRNR